MFEAMADPPGVRERCSVCGGIGEYDDGGTKCPGCDGWGFVRPAHPAAAPATEPTHDVSEPTAASRLIAHRPNALCQVQGPHRRDECASVVTPQQLADLIGGATEGLTREMLVQDVTYWSGEVQRLNRALAGALREIATLNGKMVEMAERMPVSDTSRYDEQRRLAMGEEAREKALAYLREFIAYQPGSTMRPQREKAEACLAVLRLWHRHYTAS